MRRIPDAVDGVLVAALLVVALLMSIDACRSAQARPYFLEADGGLVAWDGGGP